MDSTIIYTQTLTVSFLIFLSIYILAYFVIFRNWDPKYRAEASSSFISLTHGTPAVILAISAFLQTQISHNYASSNTDSYNRVIEFSMAYFLMDLIHYMLFFPSNILFILHHLATLYALITCRYMVRCGGYGILILLILAEVTSAFQNVWSIARFQRTDVPIAQRFYEILSPIFLTFYTVVRGILGPMFTVKMAMFYLSGKANGLIPRWAWMSWTIITVIFILVSMLWVSNHWTAFLRERSIAQKKAR